MNDPDPLDGISVFVAVAHAGTFTAAARKLGLTKSAVGKAISRLEQRLGFALFHRTTRVTKLTTDGEAYLGACTAALDEIVTAQSALTTHHKKLSGRVHIDMPVAFGRTVLLPLLMEMTRPHPDLGLSLTFSESSSDLLQDGVDLAIRFGALPDSSDLVARRLATQRRVICASPAYLRARGTPEALPDLAGHHCIVGTMAGPPQVWFVKEGNKDKRFTPPQTHRLSDGAAMIDAAIGGLGLLQLPVSILRKALSDGRLVPVLESLSGTDVDVHVMWPHQSHLNPRVRYVIDGLLAYAAQGKLD